MRVIYCKCKLAELQLLEPKKIKQFLAAAVTLTVTGDIDSEGY